jgi:hypothetical protein
MTAPDREQLKHDLSDALSALQKDQTVLGLDELRLRWSGPCRRVPDLLPRSG